VGVKLELTPEDYEDGVAELLAQKFDGRGQVERDVRLPSRSGGKDRQIDILIRVPLADMGEELMVVDCKRYGTKVDIKDVEAFIGMVEDVGAAIGLLVTTEGYTVGATGRAAAARGIRIEVVRVEDLPVWEPPLITCDLCREAIGEDAMPGMAWIDQQDTLETEDEEGVEATFGYCEKCGGLHVECPKCGTLNSISEGPDEWVECEGGCGVEFHLRRMMMKDDLSNPTHDRLTLRGAA
jgi:Restriction endonuclease